MKTIISWSGGKDSTATIILAHELGIQVDEVVFSEVMYDHIRGISGELPPFISWVKNTAIPKIEAWGYKVTVLHSEQDFLDLFFHRIRGRKAKNRGMLTGYMIPGRCWANSVLKVAPIKKHLKLYGEVKQLIGIAADEPKRLARLKNNQRSLLAEQNMTEADAKSLCERYDMLAPTYSMSSRGGCWFCPNGGVRRASYMKQSHPELYQEFIGLANSLLVSRKFDSQKTIDDLAKKVDEYINMQKAQMEMTF